MLTITSPTTTESTDCAIQTDTRPTAVTAAECLERNGALTACGGVQYMLDLIELVLS
jgi:hypothetical protein